MDRFNGKRINRPTILIRAVYRPRSDDLGETMMCAAGAWSVKLQVRCVTLRRTLQSAVNDPSSRYRAARHCVTLRCAISCNRATPAARAHYRCRYVHHSGNFVEVLKRAKTPCDAAAKAARDFSYFSSCKMIQLMPNLFIFEYNRTS